MPCASYVDPRLAGGIERADGGRIDQRVHLGDDARRLARLRALGLPVDHLRDSGR